MQSQAAVWEHSLVGFMLQIPVGKLEEFILGLDFSVFKNFVDFKLSKAGLVDGKKLKVFWHLSLKQGNHRAGNKI